MWDWYYLEEPARFSRSGDRNSNRLLSVYLIMSINTSRSDSHRSTKKKRPPRQLRACTSISDFRQKAIGQTAVTGAPDGPKVKTYD